MWGSDYSRFFISKRGVEDKNCGPLIKTIMTRCIHCTRCVRFGSEIAGTGELGTTGRGSNLEIGFYVREKLFASELSGNVIDLCPVGALTSKPYAFMARPWELESTETIDLTDGIGSNVKMDSRFGVPMRITPKLNEEINEEWISDKARYSYEGITNKRTFMPPEETASLVHSTHKSFALDSKAAVLSGTVSQETVGVVTDYFENVALEGPNPTERNWNNVLFPIDFRSTFKCNTPIEQWESTNVDFILLVGVNPRYEGTLLNARIRKRLKKGNCHVVSFGAPISTTYPVVSGGTSAHSFMQFVEGRSSLCKTYQNAKHPIVLVGPSLFLRADSNAWFSMLQTLISVVPNLVTSTWNGLNYLQPQANSFGAMDQGVHQIGNVEGVQFKTMVQTLSGKSDVPAIYIASHTSNDVSESTFVVPCALAAEVGGTYANTEGRSQYARKAVTNQRRVFHDKTILSSFIELNGVKVFPKNYSLGVVSHSNVDIQLKNHWYPKYNKTYVENTPLRTWVDNYYTTDSVTKNSPSLVKVSKEYKKGIFGSKK
jgi:NADH dehydrogenase (ubiquinone) Fe-S protein 1